MYIIKEENEQFIIDFNENPPQWGQNLGDIEETFQIDIDGDTKIGINIDSLNDIPNLVYVDANNYLLKTSIMFESSSMKEENIYILNNNDSTLTKIKMYNYDFIIYDSSFEYANGSVYTTYNKPVAIKLITVMISSI